MKEDRTPKPAFASLEEWKQCRPTAEELLPLLNEAAELKDFNQMLLVQILMELELLTKECNQTCDCGNGGEHGADDRNNQSNSAV